MRSAHWARLELPWRDPLEILLPDDYDSLAMQVLGAGRSFPLHFELALDLAPPGGAILDLGAHLGTFTLVAAASGRRVIAVEASSRNVELLEKSARANGLDDAITIIPASVSNRSGMVRFQQEAAWGRIADARWATDVVEVPARTVTEILGELGVGRVDVVKMDVDGFEMAAIEGMAALLSVPQAPRVVYKSNAHTLRMFDATPEQLVGALAELGYGNYLVGGEERELTPVTPSSFQPDTNVDNLAVKGALDLPASWSVRRPRTDNDLARVVRAESCEPSFAVRAQLARSLERAPASLLARRDVQLPLAALAMDPDETVARAAAWWVSAERDAQLGLAGVQRSFHALGEQGRALRDRLGQIRIRWGARP
jgi:FkbM family methyltransferase